MVSPNPFVDHSDGVPESFCRPFRWCPRPFFWSLLPPFARSRHRRGLGVFRLLLGGARLDGILPLFSAAARGRALLLLFLRRHHRRALLGHAIELLILGLALPLLAVRGVVQVRACRLGFFGACDGTLLDGSARVGA